MKIPLKYHKEMTQMIIIINPTNEVISRFHEKIHLSKNNDISIIRRQRQLVYLILKEAGIIQINHASLTIHSSHFTSSPKEYILDSSHLIDSKLSLIFKIILNYNMNLTFKFKI